MQQSSAISAVRDDGGHGKVKVRKVSWSNLAVGAVMNLFQVTTLGQPFEVLKTHAAANRNDTILQGIRKTWSRGGIAGFYQGLIPWAWIEASTKGSVLLLTSTEVESLSRNSLHLSPTASGVLGGVCGGAAQAYLTMGFTTCMKTIEVTRDKTTVNGQKPRSSVSVFAEILRTQGIRGVNKGVNAVAMRQITGWSSRIGISRFAETLICRIRGIGDSSAIESSASGQTKRKLGVGDKILASSIGGALSCWNQPFEVIRIEMQSLKSDPSRPEKLTMISTARHIYRTSGLSGFFRGVVPRFGLAAWATICMVGLGDVVKERVARLTKV
ncbi:mitochondrial DNA replication protein [Myxozyma melibiosi]|uniref:Mitochondrial DNA replication protein n=1 Tax=Myxozyma melibiosi TaxID=54550 RepID=A0ABR1FDB0_9ASCO